MTPSLWETAVELAAFHLHEKGYVILQMNQRLTNRLVADVVAVKDDVLHFVSVRLIDMNNQDEKTGGRDEWLGGKGSYRESTAYLEDVVRTYKELYHIVGATHTIDRIAIVYRSVQDYYLQHYENII